MTLTRGSWVPRSSARLWSAAVLCRFSKGPRCPTEMIAPTERSLAQLAGFKKNFRCLSLIGIPSFSITLSMSSQTWRFTLSA